MSSNFIQVTVNVNGTENKIRMQKGCLFQNKGGSYLVTDDGKLKFKPNGDNSVWTEKSEINMTGYQWQAFQNVADNSTDNSKVLTYSQEDIKLAMQKFANGEFTEDMSKDLPYGYSIEKTGEQKPKKSTKDNSVELYVTNGKETQSARLKFQIAEMAAIKEASQKYQAQAEKPQAQKSKKSEQTPKNESKPKQSLQIKSYVVQGGDSLGKIASENNITVSQLKKFNGMRGDTIRVGQKLFLENPAPPPISSEQRAKLRSKAAKEAGVSAELVRNIELYEKEEFYLRDDGYGNHTIGFGHNTKSNRDANKYRGRVISHEEAYDLLAEDIKKAKNAVIQTIGKDAFSKLKPLQRDAIIDLFFNSNVRSGSGLVSNLKKGDHKGVILSMNYICAGDSSRAEAGLCKRRFFDISTFLEGTYDANHLKGKKDRHTGTQFPNENGVQIMDFIQDIYNKGYANCSKNGRKDYNETFQKYFKKYIDMGWLNVRQ